MKLCAWKWNRYCERTSRTEVFSTYLLTKSRSTSMPMPLADCLPASRSVRTRSFRRWPAALTVAHAAGVLHRDIIPEHIILRSDGYVKVLDSGLAELYESHSGRPNINANSTIALVHTEPGT